MRFLAIALCCIALAGCASMRQQTPPPCRGEYRPINAVQPTEVVQPTAAVTTPLVIEEVSGE